MRIGAASLALVAILSSCRGRRAEEAEPAPAPAALAPLAEPATFVELARRLNPSVVTIRTSARVAVDRGWFWMPEEVDQSLGSGFIIDATHILTNHHVVAAASDITVILYDGRELPARIIGRDEDSDIGVLEVDARNRPLTAAPLGDSDALEVGEWVLAIGSPFGLDHSVTAGIVSAKGRTFRELGRGAYFSSFIQTDASINPGNSGGPLLNLRGEVVGINTAVDTRGLGIGYAIPIDNAKRILPMLLRDGRVARSWLGVYVAPVTEELARELELEAPRGVLVAGVVDGSPAAKAGLRRGDVVLELDGEPVDVKTLPWLASVAGVGRKVEVTVWREGARRRLTVVMERLPD